MAVPKKRRSKAKKRTRRALWTITTPNLRPCPSCGAKTYSHRACAVCGQYNGQQVITIKEKKTQQEEE